MARLYRKTGTESELMYEGCQRRDNGIARLPLGLAGVRKVAQPPSLVSPRQSSSGKSG